jgi:radical SAM protein with 4Fe4S-binding SPASM domain
MYPYLKSKIVIVKGPGASGLYDLNEGSFQRLNHFAGDVLSNLTGERLWDSFDSDSRVFLESCVQAGFVAKQPYPMAHAPTPLSEVIREIRPVRFAWIELTSKCNQLCRHCFLGDDLNAHPPYSATEVYSMLSDLDRAGARQIIFSGGEPLAHPQFAEILEHAGSRYRFKLSVLTNGSHPKLLSVITSLIAYEVTVKIPILGWGDSHDQMAGLKGGFAKTIGAIKALKSAGVSVQLGTTVTSINHEDIPSIRRFADEHNLPLEVSPLYAVGYAKRNENEMYAHISQAEIVSTCTRDKEHQQLMQLKAQPLQSMVTRRFAMDPTDYDSVNLKDYLTAHSECGQKIIAILSSREVTPCLLLREKSHSIGSLSRYSLSEILSHVTENAPAFDELMKLENVPGCNKCEARFVCKAGGCPASANAFSGSVQVKNPLFTECYYTNPVTRAESAAMNL